MEMNVVKEAIRGQKLPFVMIILSTLALLVSFVNINTTETPLYFGIGLLVVFIVPAILASINKYEEMSIVDELVNALIIIALAITVMATLYSENAFETYVLVPIVACGVPIIIGAIVGVVRDHDITADVLVAIAIVASIAIGEYTAAATVAIIMQIGSFLEEATVAHANSCIKGLHDMQPKYARIVRDGKELLTAVDIVKVGDIVRIRPGEGIPADGKIISGESSVDQSALTGESVPRNVTVGDKVSAGTTNMYGSVDICVESVGEDCTIAKIAKIIEEADASKSKIVRTADKWARYIVAAALGVSILTYIFTNDIIRAVTVLVVFCPCALILATPTAIMAAAGNVSKYGILIKDGGALERLANVDTILMDKTGTLTTGTVECIDFVSCDPSITPGKMGWLAGAVETRSEHPIGRAIVDAAGNVPEASIFNYVPGKGVSGTVEGTEVSAGNKKFMMETCPEGFESAESSARVKEDAGYSIVYIGIDGKTVGYAVLADTLKPTSHYAVRHLRMLRMKRIMITGDSEKAASRIGSELGVDDVVWECMPEDKLHIVDKLDTNGNTCMVGDGVNDAASLKRAGVGIAMGGLGKDIAMDASDVVIMDNSLGSLPGLIVMAKRTLATIRVGIAFALTVNVIATALAIMGLMGPIAGALVHNIGSIIVILGAVALLRFDPWKPGRHAKRVRSAAKNRN